MPGIIGTSTEKMIANAPITVSFVYAAALAVQKKSGANNSHSPTAVVPHCAHANEATGLDLPEKYFDGVFANAALFHVPSQELPRVLLEPGAKPEASILATQTR